MPACHNADSGAMVPHPTHWEGRASISRRRATFAQLACGGKLPGSNRSRYLPVTDNPVSQALAGSWANLRIARDPGLGRLFGLKSIITVSTGYRHTLGQLCSPSAPPELHRWSGSSSPGTRFAPARLKGWAAASLKGGYPIAACEVERDGKLSGVGNGWFLARLHQALKKGRRCGIAFAPPDGPDVP